MSKKIILSLLVGGLMSVATLYLAFRNVPLAELVSYLGSIAYLWLIPSVGLVALAFVLRAYRWRLILKSAKSVGFWQAYHPLMIGFMINCILPGRVGEIARPAIIKREQSVPFSTGFATVAAERIFDMLVLIALLAAVFTTVTRQPDLDIAFGGWRLNSQVLQTAAWAMIRVAVVLLIGLACLAFSITRRWMVRSIEAVIGLIGRISPALGPRAEKAGRFFIGIVEGFAVGLGLVAHPRRALACLGLTILIWAISALSYWTFSLGCPGIHLSYIEMTTVMVVVCFFIALPSAPGFWGLWEAGAGFTLVNHAVQMFPVILLGLFSALITSVNIWQLTYGEKKIAPDAKEAQRSVIHEPS
ncbi:MAG: flippase-like domain-containing protein [Desulfatitalea sp.]|nr:flippase-like domain-containing protein [Desulfatitalea sp.]